MLVPIAVIVSLDQFPCTQTRGARTKVPTRPIISTYVIQITDSSRPTPLESRSFPGVVSTAVNSLESAMLSYIFGVPDTLEWKQAYIAATQEKDRTRVANLIQNARSKFATRLDEL